MSDQRGVQRIASSAMTSPCSGTGSRGYSRAGGPRGSHTRLRRRRSVRVAEPVGASDTLVLDGIGAAAAGTGSRCSFISPRSTAVRERSDLHDVRRAEGDAGGGRRGPRRLAVLREALLLR